MPRSPYRTKSSETAFRQALLEHDAWSERRWRLAEPVLLNQPDIVATGRKVSTKEHARWQFPGEYLYEEDEVLCLFTSHDLSRRLQNPAAWRYFNSRGIGQLTVGVLSLTLLK